MDRFSELLPKHRKPSVDEMDEYLDIKREEQAELQEIKELAEQARQRRTPIGYIVGD